MVAPKPVNVLAILPTMTLEHLATLGVRRISIGGQLARVAWTGFLGSAREMAEQGTFTAFAGTVKPADMNATFVGNG